MQRIVALLKQYSNFLYFLVLQVVCFFFIIGNNNFHHAKFWNSSNAVVGRMNEFQTGLTDYFNLGEANIKLAKENARLKEELFGIDSLAYADWRMGYDSLRSIQFEYLPAKVINSSSKFEKNYLSINIGTSNGVNPNELMGVIGPNGVVGYTKVGSSSNYTEVVSLLHANFILGALHEKSDQKGSINWEMDDDRLTATLSKIPRYADVFVGDSIVTSGNNGVFPRGELIGIIANIKEVTGTNFFRIKVKLSTDFNKVYHVHVVRNNKLLELKELIDGQESVIKDVQ